ncbi:hypothetical protein NQ314_010727 [Rhamnusium bicolor]|uniref:Uncharacterized protein n=1 Tax=Rhamnusium bicolor TaxID=1586634 RepID=A0AAV8XPN0_9CUCU|nr:hypothetical protein NQ314_010727 [Rhamnusium bicolor]
MSEKIAVVTGSNKGVGYAIVMGLCERFKGTVYLTARYEENGKDAIAKLKKLGYQPLFHQLDITDQTSVNKFKKHIQTTHGGLDLLINNAGILFPMDAVESFAEQAEKMVAVNYFGTLRVCEALFPLLRNNAKVVNISSSAGHLYRIPSASVRDKFRDFGLTIPKLNEIMENFVMDAKENKAQQEGWGNPPHCAYVISKVGASALTIIQQGLFNHEIPNRNISVNHVHPGLVKTDLNSNGNLTIEQGARAPLYVALDANFKGKYVWSNCQIVDWYRQPTPASIILLKIYVYFGVNLKIKFEL